MTKEQIDALEEWIVTIIRDERERSCADYLARFAAKEDVLSAFNRETRDA